MIYLNSPKSAKIVYISLFSRNRTSMTSRMTWQVTRWLCKQSHYENLGATGNSLLPYLVIFYRNLVLEVLTPSSFSPTSSLVIRWGWIFIFIDWMVRIYGIIMDIYGDNPSVRISWCHLLLVLWNLFVTYLVAFLIF